MRGDNHLLAVGRDLIGRAAGEDLRFLPLVEVEHVDGRPLARAAAAVVEAAANRREVPVVRGGHGQHADALHEAVGVHADLRRAFLLRLLLLRLGLGALRLGDLHLVALRAERVRRVLRQRDEVDLRHVGVDRLELVLPVGRPERAGRHEVEQRAVLAERGVGDAEPAVGGRDLLLRGERVEEDPAGALLLRLGVGDPLAVGRPRVVGDLPVLRRVHLGHDLRADVHVAQALHAVRPEQLLAVGRPDGLVLVVVAVLRHLDRRALAVLRLDPDLVLAGPVRDVGDPAAVGRPLRVALVHAGGLRQVPRRAVLGGHGEHVAARAEERPAAVGRDLEVRHHLAHVDQGRPPAVEILGDGDRHLRRLLGREVEPVDVAAVLEHDGVVAERGELDVEVGEVGELLRLLRAEVVAVQVHVVGRVAIRGEVDRVALPHRDDVLRRVVRQVRRLFRGEVVQPEVVGHAAPVALPRAELAEDVVVDDLRPVGREGPEAAVREGQLLERAAVDVGEVELAEEIVPVDPPRAEEDVRRVLPAHDQVVRAHAV